MWIKNKSLFWETSPKRPTTFRFLLQGRQELQVERWAAQGKHEKKLNWPVNAHCLWEQVKVREISNNNFPLLRSKDCDHLWYWECFVAGKASRTGGRSTCSWWLGCHKTSPNQKATEPSFHGAGWYLQTQSAWSNSMGFLRSVSLSGSFVHSTHAVPLFETLL